MNIVNVTISLEVLLEKGFEPSSMDAEGFFRKFDEKSTVFLINRLPEIYKKIIHMKYVQNFSLREISGAVGASKGTIAVQAYRGLEKLRTLYNSTNKS